MTMIERQARAAGGAVVVTVGDHNLHNAPKLWREKMQLLKLDENEYEYPFPSWMHAAYIVDRTLFVHGSLSKTVFENYNILVFDCCVPWLFDFPASEERFIHFGMPLLIR